MDDDRIMTTPDAAIRTVATMAPVWAEPGHTLRTMADTMHRHRCGALLVHNREGGIGIVTERDLVRALAEGADADGSWVTDVMTRNVLTTSADEPILSVAALLSEAGIRHAVLVDEHDAVVGVASLRDLVRPLLDEALAARRG